MFFHKHSKGFEPLRGFEIFAIKETIAIFAANPIYYD